MKRLTTRRMPGGQMWPDGHAFAKHEDDDSSLGLGPIIEKLATYEDYEEQGLMVLLPCRIGDHLWRIKPEGENHEIEELIADQFMILGVVGAPMDVLVCAHNKNDNDWTYGDVEGAYYSKTFGKTIFRSRSDAENSPLWKGTEKCEKDPMETKEAET